MQHIVKLSKPLTFSGRESYVAHASFETLLEHVPDESIDVIYADPPYNTGVMRVDPRNRSIAYSDNTSWDVWLEFTKSLATHCRRVLKSHGSMYLHLDWRCVHEAKVLTMDTVFGRENYLGEIVWAYDWGARQKNCFSRKHDTILHYAKKVGEHRFDVAKLDRLPYKAPELQMYRAKRLGKQDGAARIAVGKPVTDVFSDINVLGTSSNERMLNSYPTMKPAKLVKRLLSPVVISGSVVLDPFCGSGVTIQAASELDCSFVVGDANVKATLIAVKRARKLQTAFSIVEC